MNGSKFYDYLFEEDASLEQMFVTDRYVCSYIYIYMYMCVCVYVCMYMYIYNTDGYVCVISMYVCAYVVM